MRQWFVVLVPLLPMPMGACGGSTSSGASGSQSSAAADAYCAAESGWHDRCQNAMCDSAIACPVDAGCSPPSPAPCSVSGLTCTAHGPGCLARMFRPEALAQMKACEDQLACGVGAQQCLDDVTLSPPSPSAVAFASACNARLQACQGQMGEEQFFCFDVSAVTDEVVALMRACLDQPCSAIRSCDDGAKIDTFCAG